MKKIKSFLSMLLSVALLVSAIPLSAIAISETEATVGMLVNGSEIVDTGSCGDGNYASLKDNLTYTFYENGLLVIDGIGEMSDFTLSYSSFIPYQPWSEYREQITSVYVSDGVTSIGDYAFWGCYNLSEIQLGDTITSFGSDAFSSTEYVSNSANWDNSVLYIGNYLIDSNYSELPSRIVVKDGTKVIADRAFWNRDTLQTIVLPNSLKTIGVDVFSCADGLENIVFNGTVEEYCNISFGSNLYFRSHNTYIDGSLATNVVIPEGVQNIQQAFDRCSSIVSVSVPSTVTNMGAAFNNCYSLKEVTIANGIKNVTGFTGCSSLKKISLPDSVETISGFSESGLQEIAIGKGLKEVTGQTFHNCYNLEKVYYTGSVDDWCQISFSGFNCNGGRCSNPLYFGADLYIDNERMTDVNIQEISSTLNANSFCGCGSIVNLKLNDQITKIGGGAFDGCSSLERVILPFNLEIIGGESFYSCNNLRTITIADKVKEVQTNAFAYCNIENLIIADKSTTISKKMVVAWSSLKNVYIPKSVTAIANSAFSNRTSITDVYFAGSEAEWNEISIGTSNECLTNATIHFNSTSPKEPVFIDVRYGSDRFTFGEDITGYVGDVIDSLVVYTSANENIASLDITSSNTDIVEIGTIEIGVGDYITSENEHMATIPLKLKAEGTSTITITSPEGVSESVKVTVSKAPEVKKSIAVFTTEKSLSVNTGDSMWLAFGLMNEDTGLVEEDWRKMAITVSDPTIIALSDYEETEYGYSLEVIGKKEGSTNVTITDTETGINTIIVINVLDSFVQTYSYAIDDMKVFYPNNQWEDHIATNIYNLNGIYVNNYQCIKNGSTYNIDFDVYNSRYYAGSVDIYDESGMWLGYEEIVKYSDITSLWSTGEQAYYLISNTVAALIPGGNESNLLTYEQESFSKHTHISLQIPEGGYFTISNNVATSPGTFFINAFEILFDGAYTALDLVTSDSVKTTALSGFKKSAAKSLADRLIEARNEGLKNELKKKAQKVMLGTMQSEITKITKKFAQAELKDQLVSTDETCSEMANLAENILSSYNISWKHLFQTATGVGESFFSSLSGPAGVALKGCFAITKSTNKLLMATQMATSTQKPYVTVYSKIQEGYINPYGVIVNTAGNMDAEAVLQVFRVSNDDAVDVILNSNNPLEKHELYNICFVKDDQLVQPSGKVTVHIPIPEGMNSNTCKVYRQESDGAWTILDAHIEGNYLVFETDHFSLYSVIGDMNNLGVDSLPNKVVYTDGDTLDTTGLVLNLNGELISEGFVCEPMVLSGAGNLKVTVRYGNATADFDVKVKAPGGYIVSGSVLSFGEQKENCTLRLIDESGSIETLVTATGNYSFENIAVGTYTLEVSKANHVTRTCKITVTDEDVVQDVKIHLLGDINGDGLLNIMDVNRANAHAKKRSTLTGYDFACADINGDEAINIMDVNRMNAHAKKHALLW